MRVGVRRLRALLSAVQEWDAMPEETADELRWLGQELGRVRNWDVFLESTLPGLGGASQPVEAMARHLASEQHAQIREVLQGPRFKALMAELALWSLERLWRDPARIQPWDVLCSARRACVSRNRYAGSMGRGPPACIGCVSR
jgi:CHAD domain-containing protein